MTSCDATAVTLAALLAIAGPAALAQDSDEQAAEPSAVEQTESSDDAIDEAAIESGAVDATVELGPAETIFTPSEEIKADTEISFPSDI